jgi:hypothetical protein
MALRAVPAHCPEWCLVDVFDNQGKFAAQSVIAGRNNYSHTVLLIMVTRGRYGAGIVLHYTGAIAKNNIMARNNGGQDFGGSGIWIYSNGPAAKLVENNTIAVNSSSLDGGQAA